MEVVPIMAGYDADFTSSCLSLVVFSENVLTQICSSFIDVYVFLNSSIVFGFSREKTIIMGLLSTEKVITATLFGEMGNVKKDSFWFSRVVLSLSNLTHRLRYFSDFVIMSCNKGLSSVTNLAITDLIITAINFSNTDSNGFNHFVLITVNYTATH